MCELCVVIFVAKCQLSWSFVNFNNCFDFVVKCELL
jgi:hypothetical protein